MNQNEEFYVFQRNMQVAKSMQGGFLYIGTNSSVNSSFNTYKNARAHVGGCVAIQGYASATFEWDNFNMCGANLGGAIYATDFNSLSLKNCKFSNNMAY